MLDELDLQIQKLNELNDTLKSNLQKYIREQNDEIKKVTGIVKSLKEKRQAVVNGAVVREGREKKRRQLL